MRLSTVLATALLGIGLSACGSTMDRLSQVGQTPKLTAIENPTAQPGYKPVQMPMPTVQPIAYSPNSLWQSGSRTFFKDQRARNVGDILTIKVSISDKAAFDNSSERSRTSSDSTGVGGARSAPPSTTSSCPPAWRPATSRPPRGLPPTREPARSIVLRSCRPMSPPW